MQRMFASWTLRLESIPIVLSFKQHSTLLTIKQK